MSNIAFFVSIPHSGEAIPPEAEWLKSLDEVTLMGDVDRYVDRLYEPGLKQLLIPYVKTQWHRYAADLNRIPEDIDCEAVQGNLNPAGTHPRGFHWVYNTLSEKILNQPLDLNTHKNLVARVYEPFHADLRAQYDKYHTAGFKNIFHIDAHSCPSVGTNQHRDPGQARAQIIVSDSKGKSSNADFKNLVIKAYENAGFQVAYNWPYFGGRLTEQYGRPDLNHHVIQVELNRGLYMDEKTKQILPEWKSVSGQIAKALAEIQTEIPNLKI